jgi:hypothetical protein
MTIDEKIKQLADVWKSAAGALMVRIEAPYTLRGTDGTEVDCIAFLPDFGSPNGAVIGCLGDSTQKSDGELKKAAESRKIFYSFINFEAYRTYRNERFKETLIDWGFFGDEACRPSWMTKSNVT